MTVQHLLAAVDLPLDIAGSLPAGLFSHGDLIAHITSSLAVQLLRGGAAFDVAGNEEADEEVGQGSEVEDVEPDGKCLARGDDARLRELRCLGDGGHLLGAGRSGNSSSFVSDAVRAKDEILKRLQSTDGGGDDVVDRSALGSNNVFGHDVSGGDGRNVCDEGVNHGEGGSNYELGDLHAGQGALHDVGDLDGKCRESIVSVLKEAVSKAGSHMQRVSAQVKTYHQSVDKGVEEAEDPDGAGHVAHTSPHAHHGSGVVVSLQSRAVLALG